MIAALLYLMRGDERLPETFLRADEFWDDFFDQHGKATDREIAEALGPAQMSYEALFDYDRYLAKSTMPFTCLGSLYDEQKGFGGNTALAVRVIKAFEASFVSVEVKGMAIQAALVFHLDDEDDELRSRIKTRFAL